MAKRNSVPTTSVPTITASRASWSGQLLVGPHAVPVKAYSAAVSQTGSSLHQVHQACGQRIQYRKHCPTHGEVPSEQIAKAFYCAPADNMELSAEDLTRLRCEDAKSIRIDHLLPSQQMDLTLLSGRSLHLVPTHAAVEPAYTLLVQTLGASTWAIGSAVFSERRQLVAIHVRGGRLLLHVLHWPEQRRACPYREQSSTPACRKAVREFEKPLTKLRRPFAWNQYADDFQQRLTALIQEKFAVRAEVAEGPAIVSSRKQKRGPARDENAARRRRAA